MIVSLLQSQKVVLSLSILLLQVCRLRLYSILGLILGFYLLRLHLWRLSRDTTLGKWLESLKACFQSVLCTIFQDLSATYQS